jgi:uncharacterized protein DUF6880
VQELDHLRATIVETLAPEEKQTAADLMWQFLGIADSVFERTDDSGGRVDEVFGHAMEDLGRLCADLPGRDRVAIARRVLTIVDGDGFGSSGALIQCLSEALGGEGRAELRETTETAIAALPEPNTDKSWQIDSWRRRLAHRLAILADLEGDVDRYIAALCQGGLERAFIADIAGRLITSGRPTEALEWLSRSTRVLDEVDTAQIDLQVQALEALGRMDDAQKARWTYFQKTLNIEYLRAYLKRLPDFEDFEAERKAFAIAAAHRSAETALTLFVAWPDLQRADRLVRERLTGIGRGGLLYAATRGRGVGGEISGRGYPTLSLHVGKRPRSGRVEALPVCGKRSAVVCPACRSFRYGTGHRRPRRVHEAPQQAAWAQTRLLGAD